MTDTMADNYLEIRMEELRNGKLAITNRRPGIKRGAKRILIAGGERDTAYEIALGYRKEGHRVAIFDEDETAGKQMAHDHGVRFHRVSLNDGASLQRETLALLQAWRGIDTVIGCEDTCLLVKDTIMKWKNSLPIPDKTDSEIVII